MSDLTLEIQRENEEDEREKEFFHIIHKEGNQKIIFEDWLFDYEQDKLQKFIEEGLDQGYKIEIQKLGEGESPK